MGNIKSDTKPYDTPAQKLKRIKKHSTYPKQENAHNALDDARWNKKLYDFLGTPYAQIKGLKKVE